MQDGLQIAGTRGGRRRDASPPRTHMHPLECVTCQWAEYIMAQGWGARPFIFLARCRRAWSPERTGNVAQSRHAARSSVSWRWRTGSTAQAGEPLIRVRRKSSPCRMLPHRWRGSRIARGDAESVTVLRAPPSLDPPLWTVVPNKTLSIVSLNTNKSSSSTSSSLFSLSLSLSLGDHEPRRRRIYSYSMINLNRDKEHRDTGTLAHWQVCVLLLQDLLQSCSRGGGRRVEDMFYERRRAEACVDESAHHALGPVRNPVL